MSKKTLGIDLGSSSVKISILDVDSGKCVASVTTPSVEMPIAAPHSGWAEQSPTMWWDYVVEGIGSLAKSCPMSEIAAIGISYQMHGLVVVDEQGEPLRDSIIWCDSRAVGIGAEALEALGRERCLATLLN